MLSHQDFVTFQGQVTFDKTGTRIHTTVQLLQYKYQGYDYYCPYIPYVLDYLTTGGDKVTRQLFASLREDNNFTFVYESGFNDTVVFPSE